MKFQVFSKLGMFVANLIPLWMLSAGRVVYVRRGKEIGLQIKLGGK